MKNALTLIAAAHAGIALASFVAVRGIGRLLDDIARQPAAAGDFSAGIVAVAQWPMIAAWIAIAASLVALLLTRRAGAEVRSSRAAGGWLTVLGIVLGAASVLAFRGVADYLSYALKPGRLLYLTEVAERLTPASAITALCAVAAMVSAFLAFRSRAAMRVTVFAVVVSLGVSAAIIVTMRDLRAHYHYTANGGQLR
jgi:hypothetical protein